MVGNLLGRCGGHWPLWTTGWRVRYSVTNRLLGLGLLLPSPAAHSFRATYVFAYGRVRWTTRARTLFGPRTWRRSGQYLFFQLGGQTVFGRPSPPPWPYKFDLAKAADRASERGVIVLSSAVELDKGFVRFFRSWVVPTFASAHFLLFLRFNIISRSLSRSLCFSRRSPFCRRERPKLPFYSFGSGLANNVPETLFGRTLLRLVAARSAFRSVDLPTVLGGGGGNPIHPVPSR